MFLHYKTISATARVSQILDPYSWEMSLYTCFVRTSSPLPITWQPPHMFESSVAEAIYRQLSYMQGITMRMEMISIRITTLAN